MAALCPFGISSGLGYLTKSVMLPLGCVFRLALFWQKLEWRRVSGMVLAAAVFVAVGVPFCLALSQSKGRFTFRDVGIMAYRHVIGFDEEPLPPTVMAPPKAAPHVQDYSDTLHLGTYDGRFLPGFTIALFAACVASVRMEDSVNGQDSRAPSLLPCHRYCSCKPGTKEPSCSVTRNIQTGRLPRHSIRLA
jgi:hypothetical protein